MAHAWLTGHAVCTISCTRQFLPEHDAANSRWLYSRTGDASCFDRLVGMDWHVLSLPPTICSLPGLLSLYHGFYPRTGHTDLWSCLFFVGFTHGWLIAILVLLYFAFIHVIESELVGPRIVGKAIGLHPVVSLFALVAGSELFGIWGGPVRLTDCRTLASLHHHFLD